MSPACDYPQADEEYLDLFGFTDTWVTIQQSTWQGIGLEIYIRQPG